MESTIALEELLKFKSPLQDQGRTFISLYIPPAPVEAVIGQLRQEIKRTEKSINWKVKGAVIIMLRQIITFLEHLKSQFNDISSPGFALFAVPEDHEIAIIHILKPSKMAIDTFLYVLDNQFFVQDDYF
ncbi:MAG: hypothetical protein ACXAC7_02080 [Candidatus Hodarchaeales archaeon]|jgi:peptide subunit release factor 1 (eRF1)